MWNLGHMIAAQQGVCYKRAGLPSRVDETFFETFKPGSKPERLYTADDLALIKELFTATINQLADDLQTDMFGNYTMLTTRYGPELHSVTDAVAFLPFHEGLHIGVIGSLGKLVSC